MFKRLGTFFLDILEVIVFAVGIFFFVYLLIMRPHKIKGQSMMPNFPDSEYLLTEKVSYYVRKPERGDVVVLAPPPEVSETDEFIKRIIALPGERIMLKGGKVYVNNNVLNEPYLPSDIYTPTGPFMDDGEEFTIPAGEYYVMGDNRANSSDSRYWGPITRSEITGRAWVVYWPPKLAGVVQTPNYSN